MVKVIADGDVEIYDSQGNLRASMCGQCGSMVLTSDADAKESGAGFVSEDSDSGVSTGPLVECGSSI